MKKISDISDQISDIRRGFGGGDQDAMIVVAGAGGKEKKLDEGRGLTRTCPRNRFEMG